MRHILAIEQLDQPENETGRHARAMVELINRYIFEAEQHIEGVGRDRTLLLILAIFAIALSHKLFKKQMASLAMMQAER